MESQGDPAHPPPPKMFTPIGPGNHERAWNDPPMFSTEFNITGRPPANRLNKRVGHPISSSPANSNLGSANLNGPQMLASQGMQYGVSSVPPSSTANYANPPMPAPVNYAHVNFFPGEAGNPRRGN